MRTMKEVEEKRRVETGPKKLTGRQMFEQQKVLVDSDARFYDESGLNVDEAVFEGLDDLNIDDDLEDDTSE